MFFSILFDKYYQQIASALLLNYKKAVGKIHLTDITQSLETINESEFYPAREKAESLMQEFQLKYEITFKPLALPEQVLKEKIKREIESTWSGFFKTMSILIDNHDFYKDIENKFKLVYEGIVNATKILAQDLSLIAAIQTVYQEAFNVGKSREALTRNLQYLADKSTQIFTDYYQQINSLRDDIENYSEQTKKQLLKHKEKLCSQIEQLITQEKSAQSEYEQFFLNYRLLLTRRIDVIIDSLTIFSFKSQETRSEFIKQLTNLEHKHPEELCQYSQKLDQQFNDLLQSVTQMQKVEQTEKQARQTINLLAHSSYFNFFTEVAQEAEQIAIREIGNCPRETKDLTLMIDKLNTIKQNYCNKINHLLSVESNYLKLKENVITNLDSNIKFSLNLLNLNSEKISNLFVPNTSYRLIKGELNKYNPQANQALVSQLTTEGILLNISNLGEVQKEPVEIKDNLSLKEIPQQLANNIQEMGHSNLISFIPIVVDELERQDLPGFLLFCPDLEQSRPELTIFLEIRQQGKLIYIRKLINITPLPSQVLHDLLDSYKTAFRHKVSEVKNLIDDEFLANKLKLNFQGEMASVMTQAKKQLKNAYLEEVKQYVLTLGEQGNLDENLFLKTADNLIMKTLDSVCGFHKEDVKFW